VDAASLSVAHNTHCIPAAAAYHTTDSANIPVTAVVAPVGEKYAVEGTWNWWDSSFEVVVVHAVAPFHGAYCHVCNAVVVAPFVSTGSSSTDALHLGFLVKENVASRDSSPVPFVAAPSVESSDHWSIGTAPGTMTTSFSEPVWPTDSVSLSLCFQTSSCEQHAVHLMLFDLVGQDGADHVGLVHLSVLIRYVRCAIVVSFDDQKLLHF